MIKRERTTCLLFDFQNDPTNKQMQYASGIQNKMHTTFLAVSLFLFTVL